jgi:hypothetical protein
MGVSKEDILASEGRAVVVDGASSSGSQDLDMQPSSIHLLLLECIIPLSKRSLLVRLMIS